MSSRAVWRAFGSAAASSAFIFTGRSWEMPFRMHFRSSV